MADQNTTPKPEDDPFAAAFAELSKDDGAPVIVPAADAVLDGAAAADAAAEATKPATIEIEGVLPDPNAVAADGTDPAAKEGSGGAPAAAAAAAAPAKTPPAGAPSDDELAERFRRLMAESGVRAATPTAPAAPAAPAPAAAAEPPAAITPFTAEETEAIENYRKDWPEIYVAEQAMQRRNAQAIVDHVFTTLRPLLESLQGTTQQIVQTSHADQLQAAIPDIIEVAPKVLAWVETQPDYLKDTYSNVITRGSVKQVTDMVARFRAETGTAAPAPKGVPAPAPTTLTVVPPSTAAAKLAKGLAPTQGKRTGVQSDTISSDDFDGAFAAFSQVA